MSRQFYLLLVSVLFSSLVLKGQDDVNITYPNVGTLYSSDGNGLSIDWHYQSQSNDIQSLSWAYKLDEDFYGTSTSATQVDGNDSVDGSTWLSGVSYGSHTLYVALLDQADSNNVLDTDHHTFTYQSGSGGTQSGTSGTQSPDSVYIAYPNVGTLYSSDGNGLSIDWHYQSQSNDIQSLSWAYKLDEDFYGTSTSATQVDGNDSVDGSTWLSGVSYGSHTLYVALLDQADSNNVLDTDSHTFTYQSGSGGTQSGTSGTQSPDSVYIAYPNVGTLYSSDGNGLQVQWHYQSQSNGIQSLSWAYKLDEDFYGTSTSATQVDGNDSVDGSTWLSGVSYGSHTLYVALLDQADSNNVLDTDHHTFTYQSGSGGTQSGTSGTQSPDSVYIAYPNVGTLYSSDGNGLSIDWHYQSQSNDIQSLSWAYKLDEDFYGTSTSATQVDGNDSVDGSTWLSGVSYGSHTLYVALLDQADSNNVLDTDHHTFTYQSGSGGTQSGTSGTQSPDSVYIAYPNVGTLYSSDGNGLSIDWHYQSQSNDIQSLSWAYKLDEDFYGTSTSATQVDGNDSVDGSTWLSGVSYGSHTLYVALLDQADSNNVLDTDSHTFTYQSGSGGTQSGTSGTQSPDSVYIAYPNVGTLYSSDGNGLSIDWHYQSQSNDIQSLSWAYKLDEDFYGTSTSATQVDGNDSVDGSSWLSGLSYGSHTLYVALLDQADSNNVLDTDHHTFTYQSGSGGTQSGTSGTQSPDSVYIAYPNVGTLYSSDGNGLSIDWHYQSQSNDIQSLSWAYKLDEDFYGTSTSATQVDGNDSVDGSSWLSGLTADGGSHTLYVALLDQGSNVLATDNHYFTYQSGSSSTQSGDGGTQSPDGGYQSDDGGYQSGDGISIHYPDVSILYSSDYNGMQVQWNYQSQSNDMQSLSWAYKLDEDFYGTGTSATQVDGDDSVDGSSWLSSISADGQTHTLYVALLDSSGNPLTGDEHSFIYNAGSDPYSSGGDGYQSDDGGTQNGDGGYQSPGDGYQSDTSGYNTINITYPTIYNVSGWNSLEIEWTYASGVANQSSPRFGYTIDENITSQGVYINEFNTFNVYGSEWLGGLSDGEHTVYVALLDPTNGSILATDSHVFSLTSSTEPENPGTSNDDITIINPGSGSVIERNATLSVDLSYASEVSSSETPRWAYKINEDFYSTQTSAIEVNSTSVYGWLDDLEDGEHTLYVALLETYGGDFILARDSVTFELVGEDDYENPPFFYFDDIDLLEITDRDDLAEGNYTILKDHNSSESSYFDIAPVYRDENGYILVEFDSAVSSSIDFASLETYLDGNFMEPIGFVDFMPFDFHPIDRIDLNSTTELASKINGYSSLFYQVYTPHEWQSLDEFNGTVLNTNIWDVAYFAGGVVPSASGGKAILSGNASTGNDNFYVPEMLGIDEVPTDGGNSALFLNDEDVVGVELEVTLPSQENSQEFGFFIDAVDNQQDHLEVIELAWRSNGVSWSWEEPSDIDGQTTYHSLDAELNKTYKVSVTHISQNTRVWIDGEIVANIKDNNFTARSWLIGAFNDNGDSFEASIDNVRVLKALSSAQDSPDHYWALSIENSDLNKSDLVVDMAGFVYEGHFGDYWYHWFGLSTYEPNVDEEIPHRDWREHHFNLSNITIGDVYSTFPQIGQDYSLFTKNEFNMTENNELNITIGDVQLRLTELFGELSYSVQGLNDNYSPSYTVEDAAGMEMLLVKPGTFIMGDPRLHENGTYEYYQQQNTHKPHTVSLTDYFYLGKYEVTQQEFQAVMGYNPSLEGGASGGTIPVNGISWQEAQDFAKKLNEADKNLPLGWRYSLPTEAQWEYACRAGSNTVFHWGGDYETWNWGEGVSDSNANYNEDGFYQSGGDDVIEIVGNYPANAWGFHDMTGNVMEWVSDWFDVYSESPVTNPLGPSDAITLSYTMPGFPDEVYHTWAGKVVRGGSFVDSFYDLMCGKRKVMDQQVVDNGARTVGFRLALQVFQSAVEESGENNQQLPISVTNDGNIIVHESFDYESQTELSFYLTIGDEFDRNITELVTIYIEDVFEDLDGDGDEDHLDSDIDGDSYENDLETSLGFDPRNADSLPQLPIIYTLSPDYNSSGVFTLKGKVLSTGAVSLSELGFEINGDGYGLNEKISVETTIQEGSEFTLSLGNLTPGETYTYRAYASNIAGSSLGAPRKFTVERPEDWWYGADELGGGWKSNWFGVFLPQPNGWAYHADLGWAFISPDSDAGIWFWVEGNGWHWTRDGIWPFIWSNTTSDWLYIMKSGGRTFIYDYSTESFISDF